MSNSIVKNYEKHLAIINQLYSSYANYSFSFIFLVNTFHAFHRNTFEYFQLRLFISSVSFFLKSSIILEVTTSAAREFHKICWLIAGMSGERYSLTHLQLNKFIMVPSYIESGQLQVLMKVNRDHNILGGIMHLVWFLPCPRDGQFSKICISVMLSYLEYLLHIKRAALCQIISKAVNWQLQYEGPTQLMRTPIWPSVCKVSQGMIPSIS